MVQSTPPSMSRNVHPVLLLVLMVATGWCANLSAQIGLYQAGPGASSDPNATYKVEGTVINSATGDPLPRALVQVLSPVQRAMLTDPKGHFEFEGVPPGTATIQAQKPGYLPSERPGPSWQASTFPIGPQSSPVTLKLLPQGIVLGHVADSSGEAIEGATIGMFRFAVRDGLKQREQLQSQQTDEEGNFRMANLYPGSYFISVHARSNVFLADASTTRLGYPATVYYPSATDMASARPVQVAAGQMARIEFSMEKEPAFTLAGTISGYAPGQNAYVRIEDKSGDILPLAARFNPQDGTFELRTVPAGSYILRAGGQDGSGRQLNAELPLNVTRDIRGIPLALEPAISIPVVVRTEYTHLHPELQSASPKGYLPVSISLHSGDLRQPNVYLATEPTDSPDTFFLRNVPLGKFSVTLVSSGESYVQSAHYGTSDLLREELVVARGAPVFPIEIVLRDDASTLTIAVRTEDTSLPHPVILARDGAPMQMPRLIYAAGNGTTVLGGLAPGAYKMFVFDSVEQLEYTNPDVLAQYASKAVSVILAPNGQAEVSADLVRTGEQ
ncbi:MAG TPA: carboxypeptidase-like regulatory domain-containing protein [Verrucomicrobiae bacterium]|jgi:hypothetical protein|nr:carboxypeptidase-like regulatory domain-containing protein [Verrucomicrobiae bacterium]